MCNYINRRPDHVHLCLTGVGADEFLTQALEELEPGDLDAKQAEELLAGRPGSVNFCSDHDWNQLPGVRVVDADKLFEEELLDTGTDIADEIFGSDSAMARLLHSDPEALIEIALDSITTQTAAY